MRCEALGHQRADQQAEVVGVALGAAVVSSARVTLFAAAPLRGLVALQEADLIVEGLQRLAEDVQAVLLDNLCRLDQHM